MKLSVNINAIEIIRPPIIYVILTLVFKSFNDTIIGMVVDIRNEIIQKIKARQQDGFISETQKVKINNAFLDEIKLGEKMQEAAEIEAERASNLKSRRRNL